VIFVLFCCKFANNFHSTQRLKKRLQSVQNMFRQLLSYTFTSFLLFTISFFPASKPAVIEWNTPREHDFGDIKRDRPVTYVFTYKNISTEPVTLETVRTTCGCTAASWTETAVAPGAQGEVRIEYDAYQQGDFSKKIRVFFDKQRKPEILKISGSVK
jgi:Protein of unknown function (DUF1573)